MASINDVSKDVVMRLNGELYLVTDFQHVNPGKGAAFVRTRLKQLKTDKTMEQTFKSNETIDLVQVERRKMQYLYDDGTMYAFMDNSSYEQIEINSSMLEGKKKFLKDGIEVMVVFFENAPVTMELPRKITYKVTQSEPGVKGDTAGGNVTKPVTLENGLEIRVPLFIKEGENIIVNTETGQYVERA
ncbi:MAG: Elongation factor P [Candidatus Magasanikbacteria bacterium GW2011_GWA2_45_39]|uniref:Elongation factor P n=2 Tax=Candidatus Magasanikiibacteriota TaxID=1752731 RepID=A0A0G1MX61_9BACT|nr:MAG: Elongation factor P [Candidatus Magasanikbacteria bacterium GW2011_GWA2_45_39]KKU12824.1 MAG: Elongation factor P [Candidatus Magasanikbacteria bacterium GW2011_GWC2_45_8]